MVAKPGVDGKTLFSKLTGSTREALPEYGISMESQRLFGDRGGIGGRHQEPGTPVLDDLRYAADACCDDRGSSDHRFDGHMA